jgi:hypothetical protein
MIAEISDLNDDQLDRLIKLKARRKGSIVNLLYVEKLKRIWFNNKTK